MKKLLLAAALALVFTGSALAVAGYQFYWTTDKAEQVVFDSTWADRKDITLVSCSGVGRPKLDATGEPTFLRFVCEADYDAAFYGDAFTCTLTFSVRPVTDKRFALVGGANPNCLPDQGYVVGN